MSAVTPLSRVLAERCTDCGDSAGVAFMTGLLTGEGTRDDYIALVAQHYFIYEALEAVTESMAARPEAAPFITPHLTRLPAITEDLRFLLGDDWRERVAPLPSTAAYVDRIRSVAGEWTGGFIAHHYTRYLGDLSGGRFIRSLLQRRFGFDTNGVGFYLFDQIAEPRAFKSTYREQLDAVDWTDAERERVIDEVSVAYRLSTSVLSSLAEAKLQAA
ncbi:heme oxygenase (biliverdin-producing) [Marisediminicola sp. LYQ134]|uniref:biliverdin-producing heme oxygenase n=1 Tax=Marisediminicola sp. LYQ134 TaxID=3391061 RepID=UPI0039834149